MINVLILDKNEILLARIIPTGANPDMVTPLPTLNPTEPIKSFETTINTFFYTLCISSYNIHYIF